ncbi:MAG TPA: 23S rRNA (uracil(1939)-C(5))-methyltransferase RlmD [Candidatus Saccharicenans sp.]|nr:23S rRNA (uracil(1939)-C(5))-methyltransferase RlmD [Candidatus Saccharicenans sp.]HPU92877.1 23S rRNA (uracil(1939)-C(5))-methyltransferase RlmD [Candidatus Saccharicenans sp.]
MELKIEKIVYPGRSLGLHQGQVVFTDEGLPGELVSAKILAERKHFLEGKTIEILEPVPDRIKPRCSHYRACSPYQIMTYELETKIKSAQLAEILSRFKIPYPQGASKSPDLVPSPQIYGYRNKIKLTVVWNSPQPFLAYHEPASQTDLLPVENCALVSGEVNSLLSAFQELIKTSPFPAISQIEIRQSFSAGALLAILYSENKQGLTEAAGRWLPHLSNQPGLTGIAGLLPHHPAARPMSIYGQLYLEEKFEKVILRYGPECFFQVNPPQLLQVVDELKTWLKENKPPRLLDLYAGVGTFSFFLSSLASEVLAVESEPANIFYFKENLTLNKTTNIKLVAGRVEQRLNEIKAFQPEAAIVDPPRKGLEPELIATLKKIPLRSIFYLSCDPATLARDLNRLGPEYELQAMRAFDFFPRTPHLEVLTRLERAN